MSKEFKHKYKRRSNNLKRMDRRESCCHGIDKVKSMHGGVTWALVSISSSLNYDIIFGKIWAFVVL